MSGSNTFFDALTDPTTSALMGLAQGFGQAAMPTRMPTPIGAVLGMGMGGMQQGLATGQALQKQGMSNAFTRAQLGAMQQMYGGGAPGAAPGAGSGTPGPFGMPSVGPGGQQPLLSPEMSARMAQLMAMNPETAKAAGPWLDMMRSALPGPGTQMMPGGYVRNTPGALAADFSTSAAKEGGTKAAGAPYVAPQDFTVPALDASGQPILDAAGNPTFTKQLMTVPQANRYVGGGGSSAPAASGASSADPFPGWATKINHGENGTGNPNAQNPLSSATGNGQFIDQTWLNTIRATRPDLAAGKSDAELLALRSDPALSQSATEQYARSNGAFLGQNGLPVNGGTVALAHFLGPQGAARVLKSPANTPVEAILPPAVIAANPQLKGQSAGQLAASYNSRMGGNPATAPAPVMPPTQVAGPGAPTMGQGPANGTMAPGMPGGPAPAPMTPVGVNPNAPIDPSRGLVPVAGVAPPAQGQAPGIPSGPAMTPQQEAQLKINTARAMPYDLRQGGMHIDPSTGLDVKNPELREITLPNGTKQFVHVNPASPGAPPNTPGTAAPVMMVPAAQPTAPATPIGSAVSPDTQIARDKLVEEFHGKDQDSYVAAQNTQGWLNQIDHAADVVNQAGSMYQTGPYAETRLGLMGKINDASRSLHIGNIFDPQALASAEELRKATTTAGFELSSHYEGHARQAAATIQNATSAIPGYANSPVGVQLVSAGIREGAQSAMDAHEYKMNRYNGTDPYGINPTANGKTSGAGLETAETDFYKKFTPQMYSTRAISTIQPPNMAAKSLDDFNTQAAKYLPGTHVILNGQPKIIPARPDAPPIPVYIQQKFMQGAR